jgi:hypothetical protein
MNRYSRALLGGALVTALLWMSTTAAIAGRLRSSSRAWTTTLAIEIEGGFGRTACPLLTLTGSLHSETIAKVSRSLIGYVNDARSSGGACGGVITSTTVLRELLPWHVRYQSFSGSLPSISTVVTTVIGFEYRIREGFGITCLFRSTEAQPLTMTWSLEAGSAVSSATIVGGLTGDCGSAVTFSGRGSITPRTTITLI